METATGAHHHNSSDELPVTVEEPELAPTTADEKDALSPDDLGLSNSSPPTDLVFQSIFWVFFSILVVQALFHFTRFIEEPHAWRQCDTAWISHDYFVNGIDLLHPTVCWMGNHRTVILEFPVVEAAVTLSYRVFGESILVARFLYFSFFLIGVFFLFRIVSLLYDDRVAKISILAYMSAPLSLYYSRAIHIDFSVISLSLAMLYFFFVGVTRKDTVFLWLSSACASLAFLVKIPHAYFLFLPMATFAVLRGRVRWVAARVLIFVPPVFLFLLWRNHAQAVNSLAPDWDFILDYRKFSENTAWYFGSLDQRFVLDYWIMLFKKLLFEAIGVGSFVFFFVGLLRKRKVRPDAVILSWTIGCIVSLAIFFNLNLYHNYYQISFVPALAIWTGLGLNYIARKRNTLFITLFGVVVFLNIGYAERNYYNVNLQEIEIAKHIRNLTEENDPVIVSIRRRDCRNPRILARCERVGWSIEHAGLSAEVIRRLRDDWGAKYWAFVGERAPDRIVSEIKEMRLVEETELVPEGDRLFLFELGEAEQRPFEPGASAEDQRPGQNGPQQRNHALPAQNDDRASCVGRLELADPIISPVQASGHSPPSSRPANSSATTPSALWPAECCA